ncbi:MAG TPA: hypothetical protein VKG43_03510 [Acidimicrobiales bacterium]|nr:hypothetical protein [Acidimicrobiales bacterium]
MNVTVSGVLFVVGALVSLSTSWVLVQRLERVGERIGLSEGLLGLVAALAADAPEITSAISAVAHHQKTVGAGVVLGSNVFNLAALLGLAAVVAGVIALHRRVVFLSGSVALWVAVVCLLAVTGALSAVVALVLCLLALGPYAVVLGHGARWLPVSKRAAAWLEAAEADEELELSEAIAPERGRPVDVVVAGVALVVVVVASVVMERSATTIGTRYGWPEIVTGGIVLAGVTSVPNAVSAVYLARRGRGAAVLSTALNSNALNVTVGLLLPAAFVGLGAPSGQTTLVAAWYLGLTVVALILAYVGRGLGRAAGSIIIAGYLAFVAALLGTTQQAALEGPVRGPVSPASPRRSTPRMRTPRHQPAILTAPLAVSNIAFTLSRECLQRTDKVGGRRVACPWKRDEA